MQRAVGTRYAFAALLHRAALRTALFTKHLRYPENVPLEHELANQVARIMSPQMRRFIWMRFCRVKKMYQSLLALLALRDTMSSWVNIFCPFL